MLKCTRFSNLHFLSFLSFFCIVLFGVAGVYAEMDTNDFETQVQNISNYIQQNELVKAQAGLDEYWSLGGTDDHFAEHLKSIKDKFWAMGCYDQHFALCEKFVSEFPYEPNSIGLQADIVTGYISLDNQEKASEELEQFWDMYSTDERFVEYSCGIKNRYWAEGYHNEHCVLCEKLISEFPDNPLVLNLWSDDITAYIKLKELEKASDQLQRLWVLHSTSDNFTESLRSIRQVYKLKGYLSEYSALNEKIIHEFPEDLLTLDIIAEEIIEYIDNGASVDADNSLQEFWLNYKTNKNFVGTIKRIKDKYWCDGEYDEHFALCQRVVTELGDDPHSIDFMTDQITGYIKLKKADKAAEKLEMLWNLYGQDDCLVKKIVEIKDVYREKGYCKEHCALCEKVVSEFPDNSLSIDLQTSLITGYISQKDWGNASKEIEKFWSLYNSDERFVGYVCRIKNAMWASQYHTEHCDLCLRIVTEFPDDPLSIVVQADNVTAYVKLKNWERASEELDRYWDLYSLNENFSKYIKQIRDAYETKENSDGSSALCARMLKSLPDDSFTISIITDEIAASVDCNDLTRANRNLSKLWEMYSTDDRFVKYACRVKDRFWATEHYPEHFALCEKIVSQFPEDPLSIGVQVDNITGHITLGDLDKAAEELEEFWSIYSSDERFVEYACRVKDRYWTDKNLPEYFNLSSRLVEEFPEDPLAIDIQADMVAGYIKAESLSKAEVELEEFWDTYSTDEQFIKYACRIKDAYWIKEDYTEHFDLCEKIVSEFSEDPLSIGVAVDKVTGYIKLDYLEKATEELNNFWSRYVSDERFVQYACRIKDWYWKEKKYAGHFNLCQRLADEFPDNELTMGIEFDQLTGYIKLKEFAMAESKFGEFYSKYSDSSNFVDRVQSICQIFIKINDPASALPYINTTLEALSSDDRMIWLLKTKAECYIMMNSEVRADQIIDQIFADYWDQDDFVPVLYGLATNYRKSGNNEKSIELLHLLLNNTPKATEQLTAYMDIAKSYVASDEYEKVNEQLDLIRDNFSSHVRLPYTVYVIGEEYFIAAEDLRLNKMRRKASEYYQKAISIWEQKIISGMPGCDHEAEAYLFAGIGYERLGNNQKAVEYFEKVIQDWPDYQHTDAAYYFYGTCMKKLLNRNMVSKEVAVPCIEEAYKTLLENYPNYKYWDDACNRLSSLYYQNQMWDDAIKCYKKVKSQRHSPLAQYRLGECYEKIDDRENAVLYYTKFVNCEADGSKYQIANKRLKSLTFTK